MKIAILGGTGDEGFGLGYRWAAAGHDITIGSRLTEKGERAAAKLLEKLPDASVAGTDNKTAAARSELVVLSVPYEAQEATLSTVLDELAGKLLITVVAPLTRPKISHVWLPEAGSAALEAQAICGEATRVVAAFQTIAAKHLVDSDEPIESDVLICGAKKADKQLVASLAEQAGMRGVDAGPLQNAVIPEGLAAVLIGINIRNKVKDAGFKITGIEPRESE